MGKNRGGGGVINGTQERIKESQAENDRIIQKYDDIEKQYETKEYIEEISNIIDENVNILSKVDPEQKKQLENYTGSNYESINKELRSGKNEIYMDKEIRNQVSNIDKALEKLKTKEQVFFRNVKLKEDTIKIFLKEHKVGNIVKYKSYLSTSREKGNFGWNNTYSESVKLHLFGKAALIEKSSYFSEEKEGLFKRDSSFKVEAIKEINGVNHIYMKQVS